MIPPLQIAKPCPKNWDDMRGDAKRRFCDHCQLHVHNLSAMSGRERDDFVSHSGGQLCIAYVQQHDGSMQTPSRWHGILSLFAPVRWGIASVLAAVLPFAFVGCASRTVVMGRPNPACDTHQRKTAHKSDEGVMMLGAVMPTPPSQKSK